METQFPTNLMSRRFKDEPVGAELWTVPWAMVVDRNGVMRLNVNYDGHEDIRGETVRMRVTKVGANAYEVDISRVLSDFRGGYEWPPVDQHNGWATGEIIELVGSKTPNQTSQPTHP